MVAMVAILSAIWSHHLQAASPLQQLTNDPGTDVRPAWSPDGNKVAFQSNRNGSYSIWVMDANGTNQHQVTSGESNERHPAWSPDGRQLAFDSDASGSREIWIVDSDGQNRRQLTSLKALSNFPTWSPDGNQIAFYVYQAGIMSLWVVNIDGSNLRPLAPDLADERRNQCTFACHQAAWSPDGQQIAYTGGDQRSVWLVSTDGSNPRAIVSGEENNHFPWYTRDGRIGYLTEHVSPIEAWTDAWLLDPATGKAELLLDHIRLQGPLGWSPDGTKLLFHSPRGGNFDIYAADLAIEGGREALQTRPAPAVSAPEAGPDAGAASPESGSDAGATAPESSSDSEVTLPEASSESEAAEAPANAETQPTAPEASRPGAWFTSPLLWGTIIGLAGLVALIVLGVTVYVLRGSRGS
jgi:Tol biopolymer transport system component